MDRNPHPWAFRRIIEALPANVVRGSAGHVDPHRRGTVTDGRRAPVRQSAPEGILRCVASAFSFSTSGPTLCALSTFFEGFEHGRPYQVQAASNPAEAMPTLKQGRPDLIVLDPQMKGFDGLQLLQQIRVIDPIIPVIVVTGRQASHEAAELLKGRSRRHPGRDRPATWPEANAVERTDR